MYGPRPFSYASAKLGKEFMYNIKETTDFTDFKNNLYAWNGTDLKDNTISYLWDDSLTFYYFTLFIISLYLNTPLPVDMCTWCQAPLWVCSTILLLHFETVWNAIYLHCTSEHQQSYTSILAIFCLFYIQQWIKLILSDLILLYPHPWSITVT